MAPGYIRVYTAGFSSGDLTGYKIEATILPSLDFAAGVLTSELTIPNSTVRSLVPISGKTEDYTLVINLVDEGVGTNKGYSYNNVGSETGQAIQTTDEQVNFILDNVMSSNIKADYEIYIEWLDRTVRGILTIRGAVTGDDFYSSVQIIATLKKGANPFALLGS